MFAIGPRPVFQKMSPVEVPVQRPVVQGQPMQRDEGGYIGSFVMAYGLLPGARPTRLGESRRRRLPKASTLSQFVSRYDSLIPAAVDSMSLLDWEDDKERALALKRFNRTGRLKAFYYLLALADQKKPVVGDGSSISVSDEQIARMVEILDAVEDIAGAKIDGVQWSSSANRYYVEDSVIMRVYADEARYLKLEHDKLFDSQQVQTVRTKFSERNQIAVIPSTQEYTLVDEAGRVMVLRVQKPINYPYDNLSAQAVQWAIENGTVIFNLPKSGTDLLSRPLQTIFIHSTWKIQESAKSRFLGAN